MADKIKLMVEGGKVSANATMAQALGPKGINIQEVLKKLNEKTADMKGMQVPVEILINKDKTYDITVGTPPTSELIKKEASAEKGSSFPSKEYVGNLAMEQVIKISNIKKDSVLNKDIKAVINSILGTCNQMGVMVENENAKDIIKKVKKGDFDNLIKNNKTDVDSEKKEILKKGLEDIQAKFKSEVESLKAKAKKEPGAAAPAAEGAAPGAAAPAAAKKEEPKKEAKAKK
ncbi:MAG: 50S ribosomal protein L11 [Candidatus Nanoarchaeia archaeon]